MADGTIDNLQIKISADIKSAETNLEKLKRQMAKFAKEAENYKKAVDNSSTINKTVRSYDEMLKHYSRLNDLKSVFGGKEYDNYLKKFNDMSDGVRKGIDDIVVDGKKLSDIIDNAVNARRRNTDSSDWQARRDEITRQVNAVEQMRAQNEEARRFKEEWDKIFEEDGKESGFKKFVDDIKNNSSEIKTALKVGLGDGSLKEFDSLSPSMQRLAINLSKVKTAAGKAIEPFKSLVDNVKKFFDEIGGSKLAGMLSRVLRYRALAFVLNQIRDAFKEGTANLYQYSKAMGTEFAQSMDSATTSIQYFRNSIGAMAEPILNSLIPVFDRLVDSIVEGVNWLNQLFAKLSGASSWTKAIRKETQFAEAAKDAANATKRLIAGFDELNIVSSTGKSTAGKTSADYAGMFTEMPIESASESAVKWAEKLLDIWEKIRDYANEIIAGFVGFNLANMFGGDLKTSASLAVSLAGFTLEFDAIKNLASGEGTKDDIINAVLGALAGIAGLTVAFGTTGLVIGLVASATVAVASWKTTMDSKARSEYESSEFYQQILKLREGDEKRIKIKEEIEIDFANAEQRIEDINSKVAITKELLEQAFTLNGKENRTLTETEQLKAIIDQINSLGVVKLDFDGTSITNAKEEVYKLLDASEKVMLVEAYKENLKTYYKDLAEATIAYNDATDSLDTATELFTGKQEELFNQLNNTIKKKLDISEPADLAGGTLSELTEYVYKFGDALTGVTRDEINQYRTALGDATEEIDIAKEHQKYFGDAIEKIKGKINDASNAIINYGNEFKKLDGLSAEMTVDIRYTKDQAREKTDKILADLGLPGFASGGFPTVGQLFVAREAGPELVGTMGGRSAVANNSQIISGIQVGVTNAMSNVLRSSNTNGEDASEQNRLLREQNTLLRRIADKELSISPSAALGRVVKRSQKLADNVTGG